MDKRNQGQKTVCANFEFMDMLLLAWKKSPRFRSRDIQKFCQISLNSHIARNRI
jgi:hypothetical protein